MLLSSRCVATECRGVWGVTHVPRPATCAAMWQTVQLARRHGRAKARPGTFRVLRCRDRHSRVPSKILAEHDPMPIGCCNNEFSHTVGFINWRLHNECFVRYELSMKLADIIDVYVGEPAMRPGICRGSRVGAFAKHHAHRVAAHQPPIRRIRSFQRKAERLAEVAGAQIDIVHRKDVRPGSNLRAAVPIFVLCP
jgi:hypothetical protein